MNVKSERPSAGSTGRTHRWLTVAMGALMAAGLVLTADQQLYDTNYISLWEATSLLAGDHPYRDFYEYGVPLQMALSAVVQAVTGYRLLAEFSTQWLCIVAGVVLSFRLALRASGSATASVITMLLAVVGIVASMPTYHYPHIILYSASVWLAWRYIDRPVATRGAWFGALTATAFLFRHDHGLYIGIGAVATFVLARFAVPASRTLRSMAGDAAAYTVVLTLLLLPWMAAVQTGEGVPEYVRMRAALYEDWSGKDSPYLSLRAIDPIRTLTPAEEPGSWLPPPGRGRQWLYQVTLLVPLMALAGAGLSLLRRERSGAAIPADLWHVVAAAILLIVIEQRGLRDPGYFTIVAPVTAILSARLLTARGGPPSNGATDTGALRSRTALQFASRVLGIGVLLVSVVSTAAAASDAGLFELSERAESVGPTVREMLVSPPIDGHFPASQARTLDLETFERLGADLRVFLRYIHDCTQPSDRILVTGSTPYTVGYYTKRRIAGGHLLWHHRWRIDPAHQAESFVQLQSQSVPFAVSTTDPVLDEFKPYPRIHDHLVARYAEIEGSRGRLLVDRTRKPTSRYGTLGFPCFR